MRAEPYARPYLQRFACIISPDSHNNPVQAVLSPFCFVENTGTETLRNLLKVPQPGSGGGISTAGHKPLTLYDAGRMFGASFPPSQPPRILYVAWARHPRGDQVDKRARHCLPQPLASNPCPSANAGERGEVLRTEGRDAGWKGVSSAAREDTGSALLAEEPGLFLSDSAKTGKEQRVGQDPEPRWGSGHQLPHYLRTKGRLFISRGLAEHRSL